MLITGLPEGTVITRNTADDTISIAVIIPTPAGFMGGEHLALLSKLKNIVQVSIGTDHVLGLTKEGEVYMWGNGQQVQLGWRVLERNHLIGVIHRRVPLPRCQIKHVTTGSYHSFAITQVGRVWAWRLNQYSQCGIYKPWPGGAESTTTPVPTVVQSLAQYTIDLISAGGHHSTALTVDGVLLVWGRLDSGQLGMDPVALSAEDIAHDAKGNPCYLKTPHAVPGIRLSSIGRGTHHNIALSIEGQAYSWGFSGSYQTGLGPGARDEIRTPTTIENTATRGVRMAFPAAGGQFSILAGIPSKPSNYGYRGADADGI